jgi:hypothetical protein
MFGVFQCKQYEKEVKLKQVCKCVVDKLVAFLIKLNGSG